MLLTFLFTLQKRLYRSLRSEHRLRFAGLWLALALCSFSISARAQSTFVVCNASVEADVTAASGLVSIFYAPCGKHANGITQAANTSYLSVMINGDSIYTNNPNIPLFDPNAIPPGPAGFLNNGTTKFTGPNKDTIETVWEPQGPNTYKIIQDIYLAEFPIDGSGQVIFRFSIENLQNSTLFAQAQYLLDLDVAGNDAAPVTTRYGYMQTAETNFPNLNNSIPPYFLSTQQFLSSADFPGLIAEGYFNDSLAPEPMGLITPSLFAYVSWPDLVANPGNTWGFPSNAIDSDEALLLQWPPQQSLTGQAQVMACFSCGTAACSNQICLGNLDAILLHPEHIVWNPAGAGSYSPNPFPVDAIVWNANNQTASNASGTQKITDASTGDTSGPIRIISPLPTTLNGYQQSHSLSNGGTITGQQSSSISWTDQVLSGILTNCSTPVIYNIAFSVAAGGVGATTCQGGTYVCPVQVDCEAQDLLPPSHTNHLPVGKKNTCGYYTSFIDTAYDNLPNNLGNPGIDTITWVVTPPNALKVTVLPYPQCDKTDSVQIMVTQVDSLIVSNVIFTYTDCQGLSSTDTFTFNNKCLPPVPFDTLPPHFRLMDRYNANVNIPSDSAGFPCELQCSKWEVTDSVEEPAPGLQRDGGLKSVTVVSSNNMNFTLAIPVTSGLKEDTFSVCVTDSLLDGTIVIGATDSIGNVAINDTINYCTVQDTFPPVIAVDPQAGGWLVTVSETRPWDRGIDSILLYDVGDCWPVPNPSLFTIDSINDSTCSIHPIAHCPDSVFFNILITDTFMNACYTIQAWDCAGNDASGGRICKQALADTFCPTDTVVQASATEEMVIFSDFHPGINFDVGLDSIWFSNVHNMSYMYHGGPITPLTNATVIHEPDNGNPPTIFPIRDTVVLYVTNPNLQDTEMANVCWDAVDGSKANNGGGNYLCTPNDCFSYSLTQDTTPPIVTLNYDPCDSLLVTVTDTRTLDKGIYSVWLDSSYQTVNLQPFSDIDPGAKSLTFPLQIVNRDKSASGHLTAFDLYGDSSNSAAVRTKHTTSFDFAAYRENLAMKASGIVNTQSIGDDATSVTFNVPVYLDSTTDTFSLGRKNITAYQFTIQLTGSSLLSFIGTKPSITMPGWNVTSTPAGLPQSYTIKGNGPPLTDAQATDTLLYLMFTGAKSTDVEEAQIVVDSDACGNYVVYNNAQDSSAHDPFDNNWDATMPPPAGLMNGGTVIFMDSCATIVGNNPHPTILSIAPAIPNPFTRSTIVQYTVPDETNVTLELYNALGEMVRTLVNQTQIQGTYQVTLQADELPAANYFLRLQADGHVCSQQVVINK